jgi:putative atp /gtp binding protein
MEQNSWEEKISKLEVENQQLKKKVRALKDECFALEEQLEDERDEGASAEELQVLKAELEAKADEARKAQRAQEAFRLRAESAEELATAKSQALKFMQDILSAKEQTSKDGDANELQRRIEAFGAFLSEDLADLVDAIYDEESAQNLKQGFQQCYESWAYRRMKSWLHKKKAIAFIGEYSAGKTSIVNRIISPSDPTVAKLPVSARETTAIPTYITDAVRETYSYVDQGGKLRTLDQRIFEQTDKRTLAELQGLSSLIKYYVMNFPNKDLHNLSILDTPGFSSNDAEDRRRTAEVIRECDALFWVIDINAGDLNSSSLKVMDELALSVELYIVINKIDTKPYQKDREAVRAKVEKTLAHHNIPYSGILFFSEREPERLQELLTTIQNVESLGSLNEEFFDVKDTVAYYLKEIETWLLEQQKLLDKELKENEEKNVEAIDQIVNITEQVKNHCRVLYNLPSEDVGFFSGTYFKIKAHDYEGFTERLSEVFDMADESLPNSIIAYRDVQCAKEEIIDARETQKERWHRYKAVAEKFKQLTANL